MIFSFVFGFIQPFLSGKIVDDGIVKKNLEVLAILCGISLFLYVLNAILEIVKEKQRLFIYNKIRYDMERKAFLHLTKIKMNYFNDKNVSNIHQTIKEDISYISEVAGDETFQVLTSFLAAIGGGIALFCLEWRLGIAVILFMPVNCFASMILFKKNMSLAEKYINKSRGYNEWFGETVNGMKEIRLFGMQKKKENEIVEKQSELIELNNKQGLFQVENEQIQMLLLKTMSYVLYLIAGVLMVKNGITIGETVAFQTYALMLTGPISYGLMFLFQASSLIPSIKRHYAFMEYEEEEVGGEECKKNGDIVFEHLSFGYDEENMLLTDFDFRIQKGSKVAILGKNGVGKTTLLNLILRVVSPIQGDILFADKTIKDYDIFSYRKMFGVVSQNVYLFNASIRDNICLDESVGEEKLTQILQMVNLTGLISERGLDYIVGENGCMLSGGQKQKIALARALAHERPILILDEATSNLDKETIEILTGLFKSELKDNTVICVTHTKVISELFENKIYL